MSLAVMEIKLARGLACSSPNAVTRIGALVRVGFSLDGWLSTAIRQVHRSYVRKYAGRALTLHLSTVKALVWLHCGVKHAVQNT